MPSAMCATRVQKPSNLTAKSTAKEQPHILGTSVHTTSNLVLDLEWLAAIHTMQCSWYQHGYNSWQLSTPTHLGLRMHQLFQD